eukprot:COSAG01_NODE_759_length_13802_cov_16.155221_3_plen_84_part_00
MPGADSVNANVCRERLGTLDFGSISAFAQACDILRASGLAVIEHWLNSQVGGVYSLTGDDRGGRVSHGESRSLLVSTWENYCS